MYLISLYRYKKWAALLAIFFIACQLLINFKRGVVVSPFYHYGMYAALPAYGDSSFSFELVSNGRSLNPYDFSAQQWDALLLPLYYFENADSSRQLQYARDMQRIWAGMGIFTTDKAFQKPPPEKFWEQYLRLAQHITGQQKIRVNRIELRLQEQRWIIAERKPLLL